MYRPDPHAAHVDNVTLLASAGVNPPEQWSALRQRLATFTSLNKPMTGKLTKALLDPTKGDDVELLRALALAEQTEPSKLNAIVRQQISDRMRHEYAKVAADNYRAIAAQFDAAASLFIEAADLADPEADAAVMVQADDKTRKAWLAAESYANQLTRLLPVLAAAAALAGVKDGTEPDALLLPLCCTPGTAHRRRVWEAWTHTTSRCGRWSALRALDVTICACDDLPNLAAYPMPRPMETRIERLANGGQRTIEVDPEDGDYHPPTIDPMRGSDRMMAT